MTTLANGISEFCARSSRSARRQPRSRRATANDDADFYADRDSHAAPTVTATDLDTPTTAASATPLPTSASTQPVIAPLSATQASATPLLLLYDSDKLVLINRSTTR